MAVKRGFSLNEIPLIRIDIPMPFNGCLLYTSIWEEGDTMHYLNGVTDPDYCVLKFVAVSGRYYANFHSESFEII